MDKCSGEFSSIDLENCGMEGLLNDLHPVISFPESRKAENEEENLHSSDLFCCSTTLPEYKMDPTHDKYLPLRPKSPWGCFDTYDSPVEQEKEYVGIATLPNQVQRSSVKKGFEFNLMVVGESGLGKSTLVNSLFLTNLYMDRHLYDVSDNIPKTVSITKTSVDFVEKGVKLRLTIVDTPGFGDALNNDKSWQAALDYVDQQLDQYRRDEIGLTRKNMRDNRVHCCLYFISPHGHGLRPIDVEFMKALHQKVNIVPLLAKADSYTPTEISKMKTKIMTEINKNKIQIFQFPECGPEEEELLRKQDQELKRRIPFAVIGSNTVVESNGRRVRARVYPWGVVEVENPFHSDFVHLRNMLVRTHLQDLKDMTHYTLYENYRIHFLCKNPCMLRQLQEVLQWIQEQIRHGH